MPPLACSLRPPRTPAKAQSYHEGPRVRKRFSAPFAPKDLSQSYLTYSVLLAVLVFVLQCVAIALGPKPRNWLTFEFSFMSAFLPQATSPN